MGTSAVSRAAQVPALIPLSLLEAIRNLDTPVEDGLPEVADEVVAKRLGLSRTVAAQIERYRGAMERAEAVSDDEAVGVFRLVARRPDRELVFADAGRRAARHAAQLAGRAGRALRLATPARLSRRLGARTALGLCERVFGLAPVPTPGGGEPAMRAPDTPALAAAPDGGACTYYAAALGELLRGLAGFEGAVDHTRCRGRGDATCEWHAAAARGYE
jgi:hypothetical protein